MRRIALLVSAILATVGLTAPAYGGDSKPYLIEVQGSTISKVTKDLSKLGIRATTATRGRMNIVKANLTGGQVAKVKAVSGVGTVDKVHPVSIPDGEVQTVQDLLVDPTDSSLLWNLDRLDQATSRLDRKFAYPDSAGGGVRVYVVDTGVMRDSPELPNSRILAGYDAIDGGTVSGDCEGHGSHVAGTIGSETFGVAKSATIVPVRVLDCYGYGSDEGVIDGLNWVLADHAANPGAAVVNMSIGGDASALMDEATQNLVDAGITVVVAAGNDGDYPGWGNACDWSPSGVASAITVGATGNYENWWTYGETSYAVSDKRASFSNWGPCVDVFAPGVGIWSLYAADPNYIAAMDGTSMATPAVTGLAALYLADRPTATPQQVTAALLGSAVSVVTNWNTDSTTRIDTNNTTRLLANVVVPTVSAISPSTGGPGTVVTITGKDLGNATDVQLNGQSVPFTVGSATTIWATVPMGATSGYFAVTTPIGTYPSSRSFRATAKLAVPSISSISPTTSSIGNTVTLSGSNLAAADAIAFNGTVVDMSTLLITGAGSIKVTVPAGATSGKVSVTTIGGTGTSRRSLTIR